MRVSWKSIKAYLQHSPYRGAGILFYTKSNVHTSVLLGRRRRSKMWSVPGGGMDIADQGDYFSCARRELAEEFGICSNIEHILDDHGPAQLCSAIIAPGFRYRTFLVGLSEQPDLTIFPGRADNDFYKEFDDANWFWLHDLPPRVHPGVIYSITWLRLYQIIIKSR